jgi:hypothetical protein
MPLSALLFAICVMVSCGGGDAAQDASAALPITPETSGTSPATAADATTAGVITLPHPTLHNLSVEWAFTGDANANAAVSVRVRRAGSGEWRQSLPLRRVAGGNSEGVAWATRHSGSIFDLQPDTVYDIELSLNDPDGGSVQRVVQATTRAVPVPMAGAPVKRATPSTLATVMNGARPGDIVELAAGSYAGFEWTKDGSAGRPLVLRAATRGTVIIEGELGLFSRSHVHLDGLTVNGRIRLNHSNSIAVMRCTINARTGPTAGDGIVMYRRGEDAYIADNVITGTTPWANASMGVNGMNLGEGIAVTGPGHVIRNNRVSGFRDGVSFMEESEAVDQHSLDVIENDIENATDDGVEADFCRHNCRILRNRITNAFVGLSSQPSLGGPTYFVRNVLYNIAHVAFKLYRGSHGNVLLHNTVVKSGDGLGIHAGQPVGQLYTRNNLIIGGPGGTYGGYRNGSGDVLSIVDLVLANADMDCDALGADNGAFFGRVGDFAFAGLARLRSGPIEAHAVEVSMDVFAAAVPYPGNPLIRHAVPDLRIAAGSAAVDVGAVLPGINDAFAGTSPDAGAHELGAALPTYGPR